MEIRQLECFVAVAESLHFRRSAEKLFMSQATLSSVVRSLEADLGGELFDRSTRNVTLTEFGLAFLPEAEAALATVRQTYESAKVRAATDDARLLIGYQHNATGIDDVCLRAEREEPGLVIEMRHLPSGQLVAAVCDGELDAAVVFGRPDEACLGTETVSEHGWDAALPVVHCLAACKTLTLAEVASDRLVLWPREVNRYVYDQLAAALDAAVGCWRTGEEAADRQNVLKAVRRGAGIALIPASNTVPDDARLARNPQDALTLIPVADAPLTPQTVVWRRGDVRPGLVAFLRAARS